MGPAGSRVRPRVNDEKGGRNRTTVKVVQGRVGDRTQRTIRSALTLAAGGSTLQTLSIAGRVTTVTATALTCQKSLAQQISPASPVCEEFD